MEILYHPLFVVWFQDLVEADIEIAGEVQALIDELELHGRALGDPESHQLLTSGLGLRTLRRTPATDVTPYAVGPPVLRVIYGFVEISPRRIAAALLLGGDKTVLGNVWYPRNIGEAERRLTIWAAQSSWRVVQ